jgi:hypothetical protein
MNFLRQLRDVLEQKPDEFTTAYLFAFQILAETALDASSGDDADVAQNMFRKVTQAPFSVLYQKLLMRIDSDKVVQTVKRSRST